ncbi:MAG: hypothetical protein J6S85_01995 [Methanobrevibacter sp.]|nr:hypothetical protein [Methanobrevibacter sp.]
MKYYTTERELRQANCLVISIGYCDIQNLERFLNANAYTRGIYGWNSDIYNFEGFTVSTGYRPLHFIYLTDDRQRNEFLKREYDLLRAYLLALDKKIEHKKIKLPNDWHKASRKIYDMIYKAKKRITKKLNKEIYNY